jgi:lipopolysaccharide export system permease protein
MKLIDRYILMTILRPLTGSLIIALLAFVLGRLVMLFDLVANKGGSVVLVLNMLTKLMPGLLAMAVPAAFFIGIVLAIARLSSESEYDAIQTMGVGPFRLLLPIMAMAFALMAVVAVILGFLRPLTNYEYKALVYAVTHAVWNGAIERGTVMTGLGNYTIIVDRITDDGQNLSGIFLHQEEPDGGMTTVYAQEGAVYRSNVDYRLVLSLKNGTQIRSDGSNERPVVITFEKLDTPLDLTSDGDGLPERGVGGTGEFTILELWELLHEPLPDLVHLRVESEIHGRLVRTLSVLILPFLGIALGLASRPRRPRIELAGFLLLVLYHFVLQLAQGLANSGGAPPWLAYWLPFALFTCISVWTFHEMVTRPGYNPLLATIDRLSDTTDFLLRLVAGRRRPVLNREGRIAY